MIAVLLQFIPLTFAAFTPTMVMFVLALLPAEQGPRKSFAVVIGRFLAHLVLALSFVFLIRTHVEQNDSRFENELISAILVILGIVLIVLACRAILSDESEDRGPSRLSRALNSVRPVVLAAANFVIVMLSIRLMAVVAAGAAIIVAADFGPTEEIAFSVVLAGVMVIVIAIPLIVYVAMGDRGPEEVERMRRWMVSHQRLIEVASLSFFGGVLLVKGLSGIS